MSRYERERLIRDIHFGLGQKLEDLEDAMRNQLQRKYEITILALRIIANPMKHLQEKASAEGKLLDAGMALQLTRDHDYLSNIAKQTLIELGEKEDAPDA